MAMKPGGPERARGKSCPGGFAYGRVPRLKRLNVGVPRQELPPAPGAANKIGLDALKCRGGEEVCSRRFVAMQTPHALVFDPIKLPQALVGGLRAEFSGVARAPLPERLTGLLRRLGATPQEPAEEPQAQR
jgi:hypothetical protein